MNRPLRPRSANDVPNSQRQDRHGSHRHEPLPGPQLPPVQKEARQHESPEQHQATQPKLRHASVSPYTPSCAAQRALSALDATCTGGVTDLQAFEDAEQRALLAAVTLPYNTRTGQVLTGAHRGQPVWDAIQAEVTSLLNLFAHVHLTTVTVRPWQRWWRKTPAKRLMPSGPRSTTEGERR